MTLRTFLPLPVLAVACAVDIAAQNSLTKETPFVSASGPIVEAPAESIEFAGVTKVGKKTELIFVDKAAKKNRWVPLGETVDGISALNYDERLDQAVVKINGVQKTLALRKGSGPSNAPAAVAPMPAGFNTPLPAVMPAVTSLGPPTNIQPAVLQPATGQLTPAPAVPAAPVPPGQETQVKQETEARMLVSDLLEIGMAQRKAYEEAQKKAQGGEPAAPATGAPGTPPLAVPAQPAPGAQPPAPGR